MQIFFTRENKKQAVTTREVGGKAEWLALALALLELENYFKAMDHPGDVTRFLPHQHFQFVQPHFCETEITS